MTTWDDLPSRFTEHVSTHQRAVVNDLLREGYRMEMVWPDLNYEAMDRIIFSLEKEMSAGCIAQAFVSIDGNVNGSTLNECLEGKDYWWKELLP